MIRKPPKNIDVLLKETLETHVAPATFLPPLQRKTHELRKM